MWSTYLDESGNPPGGNVGPVVRAKINLASLPPNHVVAHCHSSRFSSLDGLHPCVRPITHRHVAQCSGRGFQTLQDVFHQLTFAVGPVCCRFHTIHAYWHELAARAPHRSFRRSTRILPLVFTKRLSPHGWRGPLTLPQCQLSANQVLELAHQEEEEWQRCRLRDAQAGRWSRSFPKQRVPHARRG